MNLEAPVLHATCDDLEDEVQTETTYPNWVGN